MRAVWFALLIVACNGDKDAPADDDGTPSDGDADTDADADSDADADADADTRRRRGHRHRHRRGRRSRGRGLREQPPRAARGRDLSGDRRDPDTATHLLIAGDILGDDKSWLTGQILMERATNGTITCVGCDCALEAPPETLTVSCPDAVVSPGLINSHDHIRYNLEAPGNWGTERFDHRHDWRTGARGHTEIDADDSDLPEAVMYGELRMMLGGATSITGSLSSVSGAGLMRDLDKSEGRTRASARWEVGYETFPLGDIDGHERPPAGATPTSPTAGLRPRQPIYLPHIAEGIDDEAHNEFLCLSGSSTGGVDLVEPQSAFVHGIGLERERLSVMAPAGAKLIWSPRSNIVALRRHGAGHAARQPRRARSRSAPTGCRRAR